MSAPGLDSVHRRVAAIVLARDGYRCRCDGCPKCIGRPCTRRANTADHVLERCRGGRSTLANMVAACRPCNSSRGGRVGHERRTARNRHPIFAHPADPADPADPATTTAAMFLSLGPAPTPPTGVSLSPNDPNPTKRRHTDGPETV